MTDPIRACVTASLCVGLSVPPPIRQMDSGGHWACLLRVLLYDVKRILCLKSEADVSRAGSQQIVCSAFTLGGVSMSRRHCLSRRA